MGKRSGTRSVVEAGVVRPPAPGPVVVGSSTAVPVSGRVYRFTIRADGKSEEEIKAELERHFACCEGWL
ncbi:hypothetical protein LCGC14_0968980 [marine sediment metagenome]|uniref:Uncharacterized protein n=1 Tax=marine sediment metagenome TaxID=412755 RepID=A0A0F9NYC1_9ZZZZ